MNTPDDAKPWSSFAKTVPDDLAGGAPQATPRVDAKVHSSLESCGPLYVVEADFARQLERELAEAKAQSDYHASEYHRLLGLMREQNAHTNVVEAQLTEAQAKLAARATQTAERAIDFFQLAAAHYGYIPGAELAKTDMEVLALADYLRTQLAARATLEDKP